GLRRAQRAAPRSSGMARRTGERAAGAIRGSFSTNGGGASMRTRTLTALALVTVIGALAGAARADHPPPPGGVLKAAMIGEPPALDLHWTTAVITQQITWHVYETLYTYDKDFNPIPFLAEGHTVTDGGRRYAIRLRRGIKFHTGKEMTSADV